MFIPFIGNFFQTFPVLRVNNVLVNKKTLTSKFSNFWSAEVLLSSSDDGHCFLVRAKHKVVSTTELKKINKLRFKVLQLHNSLDSIFLFKNISSLFTTMKPVDKTNYGESFDNNNSIWPQKM